METGPALFRTVYTVISITPTNAEVKLLQSADDSSIFISLDRVRLCYDEMTDDVWTGANNHSRKKKSIPAEYPKVVPIVEGMGPVTRSVACKPKCRNEP